MDEPPELPLAEELEQRLLRPILRERVAQVGEPIHPAQLCLRLQRLVDRQGQLIASSAISQAVQRREVSRRRIVDGFGIHDQRARDLPHRLVELLTAKLQAAKFSHRRPDLVVLVFPNGDALDLGAVRPQALAWSLSTLPLHHRELTFGPVQGLLDGDARDDAHRAAFTGAVALARIRPCDHT